MQNLGTCHFRWWERWGVRAANPAGGLEPGPTEAGDLPSALVTEGTTWGPMEAPPSRAGCSRRLMPPLAGAQWRGGGGGGSGVG